MSQEQHFSVLLNESIDALNIKPDGIYVDCTFGRGGHSLALLEKLGANGRLIAIDQDPEAIEYSKQIIQDERFEIVHGSFEGLVEYCEHRDLVGKIDGVLMDLGVSSPQLDQAERGFSFMKEGPLDMRMNSSTGLTAREWLAQVSETDLKNVLRKYGEERFSGRIATAIKKAIGDGKLHTTTELAELVKAVSPKVEKNKHPATRTFQAIRIAVNRELEVLETVLNAALDVLAPNGRIAAISFHSLEDRIVKVFIRDQSQVRDLFPDSPVEIAVIEPRLRKVGKPIFPSEEECKLNNRSRSAVLRIAEKLGA